ncbi:MAG: PH domain-containing protein [Roseiflexus sp.]|nr:PH domain-containing protein [Roseiflexus sp.]MCS7290027.1 PH domain-containing protein [Roseiflexus sp.]MDW8146425.1 PH domain-containing protein [Roseiflexaceae bacterium]MDW8234147.1 PH domain-containing protein [Roseiflexaceae bacterium]
METSFTAAALDPYAERITSGVATLGGILMLPTLFLYLSGLLSEGIAQTGAVVTVAVALGLAVWLALNYAIQPIAYVVTSDALIIRRRWARALRIPFKQIAGVSLAGALADVPRFGLRRSFNAGVFGYHGPFYLDPYGRVFFAATHRERLVAVARYDAPSLIISPARPRDFVEALREALLKSASDGGKAMPAQDQKASFLLQIAGSSILLSLQCVLLIDNPADCDRIHALT